jgi:hypothetical protein
MSIDCFTFLLEKPSTQLRQRVRKAGTQVLSLPALEKGPRSPWQDNSARTLWPTEGQLRLLLSVVIPGVALEERETG